MAGLSISQAWEETKARIASDGKLMMVVAAALIALPALVIGVIEPRSAASQPGLSSILLILISSLLAIVGQLAIIRLAIGPSVSVGEAIGHGARRMPIYFLAGILIAVALLIAIIPFIVVAVLLGVPFQEQAFLRSPVGLLLFCIYLALAIFVGTRMLMSSPVASEEAVGPIAIVRRSAALTSGHFWRLFGFIILFFIGAGIAISAINFVVAAIATILLGPVEPMSGSALVVALVTAVMNAIVTVVLAVMLARIYLQLTDRDSAEVSVPSSGT